MRFSCIYFVTFALLLPLSAAAGDSPAESAFEELKTLVGEWRSTNPSNATTIEIKTVANGSTLVETWVMSPSRQSMTIYTMDGDQLIATHYCPQGNAPRLKFVHADNSGAYHFNFLDGANLQNPEASHEHAFWIRKDASGTITRNETYIANGAKYDPQKDIGSTLIFSREK